MLISRLVSFAVLLLISGLAVPTAGCGAAGDGNDASSQSLPSDGAQSSDVPSGVPSGAPMPTAPAAPVQQPTLGPSPDETTGLDTIDTIDWSGYKWNVKGGHSRGPGPNEFSNTTGSVFVDAAGALHLKVRRYGGVWYSTEVWLPDALGYGTYEFRIASRVDVTDPNLVKAMFLYQDDTHEFDIEWSQWARPLDNLNADFAVQPSGTKGNALRFKKALTDGVSVQRIIWTPSVVTFQVIQNGSEIQRMDYVGSDNFVPGKAKVDLNHWQVRGLPPANLRSEDMVISGFTYSPL